MPDGSLCKPAKKASLWETHTTIHPKAVSGRFRRLKWTAMTVLMGLFWLVPWLRWDRGPDAPGQAVLFDLEQGRFFLFHVEIWPQEIYYLTGLMVLGAIGLFLATALAGRVWCGFACPHTVWSDVFIRIERAFEGDRAERIRMERAPWTVSKLLRKAGKHGAWMLVSFASAFAIVAWFTDAPALLADLAGLRASWDALTFLGLFGGSTYIMAGFAREQMCKYACPWPRIQTAMLDEHSLIVTYQSWRGDRRAPKRKSESWEDRHARGFGDCIDCTQCVQVCPMGIDVRTGAQADCINCGLCIDACDQIMAGQGRPRGLIAFDTLAAQSVRGTAEPYRVPVMRARTLVYLGLMVAIAGAMAGVFAGRSQLDVTAQRERAPLFVTLADGRVRNAYTVKVANKGHETRRYELTAVGLPGAALSVAGEEEAGLSVPLEADADSVGTHRVYVTAAPGSLTAASTPLTFVVRDEARGEQAEVETVFLGAP